MLELSCSLNHRPTEIFYESLANIRSRKEGDVPTDIDIMARTFLKIKMENTKEDKATLCGVISTFYRIYTSTIFWKAMSIKKQKKSFGIIKLLYKICIGDNEHFGDH